MRTATTEALFLPLLFLTVALLGGVRISDKIVLAAPPLFSLVLGTLLFGVLVRGRVLAADRLLSSSRSQLENLNGLVLVLVLFSASTQVFNLIVPDAGLPYLLFNVFLFVLLVNTLVGYPDRISVLRSLAVVIGAAFILKFIVLAAISDPGQGTLTRILQVLLEGVTLGTLTQETLHPATGYIAFATLVLFLLGVASLPHHSPTRALVKFDG